VPATEQIDLLPVDAKPSSRGVWSIFREAASEWSRHNAPRLGAALAYYTVLSLAPTLVIVAAVCGFVFGEQAVVGKIYWQIRDVVGSQTASIVEALLKSAHRPAAGILATLLGVIALLVGASGAFMELRDALNYIWDVPARTGSGAWGLVRDRFYSFAMVLGVGFLLIVSLALSAMTQAAASYSGRYISIPAPAVAAGNFLTTFLVTSILFALIYRIVPEVRVDWQDVAIGSMMTAALFAAGKLLIGFYLGKAGVGSAYGAAGSVVVLLVWVYYSAQVFLYGAELTHVVALRRTWPRKN
jgi:membrane protein